MLLWVPRRSHLVVSSPSDRSTRFIHEVYCGCKMQFENVGYMLL